MEVNLNILQLLFFSKYTKAKLTTKHMQELKLKMPLANDLFFFIVLEILNISRNV